MNVSFSPKTWEEYVYWQTQDRKLLKKLNSLIDEIKRSPFEGTGKPEPLRHELAGFWSRRISDEHRLIYRIKDGALEVAQCRYHY